MAPEGEAGIMLHKTESPLQNVVEHLPVQTVVEHLPQRLRPDRSRRSRRPLVLALVVLAVVVAVMAARRRSHAEMNRFEQQSDGARNEPSFVDVR